MKIRAINLSKTKRHQLSFDPDKGTNKAITWVLGALDARVYAAIKDKATAIPMSAFSGDASEATATLNINKTNFDIVLFGLKGWEGLLDEDDKPVPYATENYNFEGRTYSVVKYDLLCQLPSEVIDELANEIMDINSLKEEDRKNSEG